MSISFECAKCGKKLKAPDNAAGKTSKCPGCGSPVTCPEPVYDAEPIEAPPGGVSPYGDVDTEQPYAMVPEPAAAPSAEARRPCPMCGEMIVASAAKCRFCGEIFDSTLKKVGKGGKKGKIRSIASAQRNLQVSAGLFLACWIGAVAMTRVVGPNTDPAMILIRLIIVAVAFASVVGMSAYSFVIASKLYNTWVGILLAVLMLVPCFNLLIWLFVNQRATGLLRENGYEVGFLGAKAS
jgi:hypothetical protein